MSIFSKQNKQKSYGREFFKLRSNMKNFYQCIFLNTIIFIAGVVFMFQMNNPDYMRLIAMMTMCTIVINTTMSN